MNRVERDFSINQELKRFLEENDKRPSAVADQIGRAHV